MPQGAQKSPWGGEAWPIHCSLKGGFQGGDQMPSSTGRLAPVHRPLPTRWAKASCQLEGKKVLSETFKTKFKLPSSYSFYTKPSLMD